jgi:hypothetical protein
MIEAPIAAVHRNAAFESLGELALGACKAEESRLRRCLEAAPISLHDIVVADDAFVSEAAVAVQLGRTPGFGGVARSASEAAVVVSDEAAQGAVGRFENAGVGQAVILLALPSPG